MSSNPEDLAGVPIKSRTHSWILSIHPRLPLTSLSPENDIRTAGSSNIFDPKAQTRTQEFHHGDENHLLEKATRDKGKEATAVPELLPMEAPYRIPSGDYLNYSRGRNVFLHGSPFYYYGGESSSSRDHVASFSETSFTNSLNSALKSDSLDQSLNNVSEYTWNTTSSPTNYISKESLGKIISTKHPIRSHNFPKLETNNSPISTALTSPPTPRVRAQVPPGNNVFRRQELSKHVLGYTISLSPSVMILHYSSPKILSWGMSVAIVLLVSVGVALLWNANVVQEEHPVYAHRIQMLGFALALGAFWGLISCFLWNRHSYMFLVPIACWVVSAAILGVKAFSFRANPRHDSEVH